MSRNSRNLRRSYAALLVAAVGALLVSCNGAITLPTPPPIPVCALFTSTFTTPAGYGAPTVSPGPTVPPFLTFTPATLTVAGTPAWNDFGSHALAFDGAYPAQGSGLIAWATRITTWSAAGTLDVARPTMTFTPSPATINVSGAQNRAIVSLTVTPACAYTVAFASSDPTVLRIGVPSTATATSGVMNPIQLLYQGTAVLEPRTVQVTATITSRTPGELPVTATLDVTIQ